MNETRKLIQDFPALELREIRTRLQTFETTTKARFDAQDESSNARFNAIEGTTKARTQARFDAQDRVMTSQHSAVMSALNALTSYSGTGRTAYAA